MVTRGGIRQYAALGLVLGLAFLAFLALNRLTPPAADDWFYACRLGYDANGLLTPVARLGGVGDILPSMKCLYIAHSGRVPVHTLVQLFSLLPGAAFDLANALVFTGLLGLLVLLARPRNPMAAALAALLAALALWLAVPAFGQDFLWQSGAVNYLWTLTANLLFLLPWLRPKLADRLPGAPVFWLTLGLVSGWSMENQSAAVCALCAARLAELAIRQQRPAPWQWAGAVGQLTGFALLVLAPGNFRRSAGYGQAGLPWGQLAGRAVRYSGELCRAIGGVLAAAALLTLVLALTSRRQLGPALWLWAGALTCHGAMLASPTYPLRSMLGTLVYALAAGLYCLEQLSVSPLPVAALCGVLAVGAAGLVPGAAADLAALRAVTDGRTAYILAQKEQGIRQVTAPVALPAATRFNPLWGDALTDLAQNPAGERNRALALYYGVEAVRGDPALAGAFLPGERDQPDKNK